MDEARRDDPFDQPRDLERVGVDHVDHPRVVDHDVSAAAAHGHRLRHVAQLHAVRPQEHLVLDLPAGGVVERERRVARDEIAFAGDEDPPLRAVEQLLVGRAVIHAGGACRRTARKPYDPSNDRFHWIVVCRAERMRRSGRLPATVRIPFAAGCRNSETGNGRSSDSSPPRRLPDPEASGRECRNAFCDSQQRELSPIRTAFPFNPDRSGNHCGTKIRFFRQIGPLRPTFFRQMH